MFFEDYFEFAQFVGLLSPARTALLKLGDDGGGGFQPFQLRALLEFVAANPEYHIVTETSDCDDFESGRGWTFDNEVRYVNRLRYFLANGSRAEAHLAEEDEPDDEVDDTLEIDPAGMDPVADRRERSH